MDTLEETPIADISATYLTDEQFNTLYPKHPIDVSNDLLKVFTVLLVSQYLLLSV